MTLPIPRLFVDSRPETAKQPDVVATKTRSGDTASMRFVQHRDTQGPQSRMRENRRHGSEGRGTEFNQSVLTRSLTTVVWSKPLAASPTLPSSLCVMWRRREPNNCSNPTNLPSFRVSQRESPSEFCDFYALIIPDFLMNSLSELA